MTTYLLIGLLILLVVAAVYYQVRHQERVAERLENTLGKGRDMLAFWRREEGVVSAELPQQFTQWLNEQAEKPAQQLAERLAVLPNEQQVIFTTQVADFCSTLNFELEWLIDQKLERDPHLQAELTQVVIDYAQVQWRAMILQPDLYTFITVELWLQEPTSTAHREMARQLFNELSDRELVSVSPNMLLASDEERVDYSVQMVRQVAKEDHQAFQSAVREVLSINGAMPGMSAAVS